MPSPAALGSYSVVVIRWTHAEEFFNRRICGKLDLRDNSSAAEQLSLAIRAVRSWMMVSREAMCSFIGGEYIYASFSRSSVSLLFSPDSGEFDGGGDIEKASLHQF